MTTENSNSNEDIRQKAIYSKQDEQAAKYFLAAIVESSQDSIVSIDLHRKITTWNKAAEYLYGLKAEEAIGKQLDMVMIPTDIVDLIDKINSVSNDVAVPIYETVRLHANGKQTEMQIALSPVKDAEGNIIGVSTIARDISEKKLQEQLKDEFIAVASHELKTPITSIKAYSEILLDRFDAAKDETDQALIQKLHRQIERLTALIQTLLDTTQLSAGEVPLDIRPFDLNSLIEEQLDSIRPTTTEHQFVFYAEPLPDVLADRKLVGQAIVNLLSNAVKYSPGGGEIHVFSEKAGGGIRVRVKDFGVGIPKGISHRIFERYFRISGPRDASPSGVGLGLYITARIINQHGGKIEVESEEGMGSTFSFELPAKELQ